MLTTVLLVVAAILVILAIVLKNWIFGAIALGAVILVLILTTHAGGMLH